MLKFVHKIYKTKHFSFTRRNMFYLFLCNYLKPKKCDIILTNTKFHVTSFQKTIKVAFIIVIKHLKIQATKVQNTLFTTFICIKRWIQFVYQVSKFVQQITY